jgi:long-chain fatty acid transport protein
MSNRRRRNQLSNAFILLLAWLWLPRTSQASPLQELVGDTTSPAAMLARTLPGGSAAAYFNPALLVETPSSGVFIGFYALRQSIGVTVDGRPGAQYDIPLGIENLAHAGGKRFDNYPIATSLLELGRMKSPRESEFLARPRQAAGSGHDTTTYEAAGILVKLFDDRLAVGFHAMIPNGQFTRMRAIFNDEREQYFSNSLHPELYSDRMTALTMALGLGVAVTKQLSIGVGATFALKTAVNAGAYVADTGNLGNIQLDIDAPVNIGVAPHFGVSYQASKRFRLTATAHSPQKVELASKFKFLLANGIEQSSGLTFVLDYNPWRFGAGAAYDVVQDSTQTLTLAASAVLGMWSSYIDRHGDSPTPGYAWADTISPTGGVRYKSHAFTGSLDVLYMPTPVPPQTGRTNYVDNDRIAAALGGAYQFTLFHTDLTIGAQLALHRLIPQHQTKLPTPTTADGTQLAPERVKDELPDDAQKSGNPVPGAEGLQTNNPGWPGYASSGWIMGGTVYLSVAL